ncbi:MAG: hldE 3 [Firmicutes bacterium]|nr:hldE 3 [Bacillota bacterium]
MFSNLQKVSDFLENGISGLNVLVVGDVMLDRYYFGEVKRISPEAPVPVNRILQQHSTLGGAANVANNLALIGAGVELVGIVGDDDNNRELYRLLTQAGIASAGLAIDQRPTITKLRVLGGHQQMMRLDFEDNRPLNRTIEKRLKQYVSSAILDGRVQAVIISDYAKGVCTQALCQEMIKECSKRGIPLIVDPKGSNWKKYSGASYITPNLKELGEAAKAEIVNDDQRVKVLADKLRKRYNIENIIATRSEKGLSIINDRKDIHISTYAQEVFDVSGAGDTVVAVLGAALAGGLELSDAAHLANLAAGIVVGKIGTYAVKREELLGALRQEEVGRVERREGL